MGKGWFLWRRWEWAASMISTQEWILPPAVARLRPPSSLCLRPKKKRGNPKKRGLRPPYSLRLRPKKKSGNPKKRAVLPSPHPPLFFLLHVAAALIKHLLIRGINLRLTVL